MFCISNLIWNEEEGKKLSLLIHRQVTILIKKLLLHSNQYLQYTVQWDPKYNGKHHYGCNMEYMGVVRRHWGGCRDFLGETQGHSDNKQELERHSGRFSPVAFLWSLKTIGVKENSSKSFQILKGVWKLIFGGNRFTGENKWIKRGFLAKKFSTVWMAWVAWAETS